MNRFRLVCIVLILGILGACSNPQVQRESQTVDPAKPTIMIAMLKDSQTPYKQELIDLIRSDYSGEYNLNILTVNAPKDIAGQEYSALIVMDTLKAWLLFNPGLKRFTKLPDQSKIVYFVSSGDPDWKWKRNDIRIITGATKTNPAAKTYSELKIHLDAILIP